MILEFYQESVMFLFILHICFKRPSRTQAGLDKAGLSTALLMLSLAAHAVPSDTVENAAGDAPAPALQKQDVQPQPDRMSDNRAQRLNFPGWPQHQQGNRAIIPPPPPGPYVSSALSDYSVRAPAPGPRFGKHMPRRPPAPRKGSASVPMDTFSPDIPWPKNLRPERRMPDHRVSGQGNHYAKPKAMQKQLPVSPYGPTNRNRYSNFNYGKRQGQYLSGPKMNDMGMNGSRWMPSMGMMSQGPYNNRLNHAPSYGSNYNPLYSQPVNNSKGTKSTNHPYR
jgi:hypothetical protein